jgi:hypothetical protein
MAESDFHAQLVDRIVRSIQVERPGKYDVFVDSRAGNADLLPPMINSVRPDVFARHCFTKIALIGEAKTENDINNAHTELQLLTYFQFLAAEGNGELHIAVPWRALDKMDFAVRRVRRLAQAQNIPYTVSGWALPDADYRLMRHG